MTDDQLTKIEKQLTEMKQEAIDYGYWFAKNYFHGYIVALLSGKISEELLKEVEEVFK